jgi:hypothetical protein
MLQASTMKAMTPGYNLLESMPDTIAAVVAGLLREQAHWKPAPDRWSVVDVLGHMAHVEVHGFRQRVERILAEENPRLENYDPDEQRAAGRYAQADLETALQAFTEARGKSLALLRTIPSDAYERGAIHASLGPVTLGNLLHEWPFHDLGHLRQIAELVRAVRFYPHMGAWQSFYTLQP